MKEWTDPFNSFNSLKGLLYRPWLEGILRGEFLPPIEASIDPAFLCNLDCQWCNSHYILKNGDDHGGEKMGDNGNHIEKHTNSRMMSRDHLFNLCNFLMDWGVQGYCFAGGGEPFIHRDLWEITRHIAERGFDTAFLTNGSMMDLRDIETVVRYSRWIGVSVDAGNRDSYARLKGVSPEVFDKTVENLKRMVELKKQMGTRIEISLKFLICPDNSGEIFDATCLAKKIGVDYIHIRPAAYQNIIGNGNLKYQFPVSLIEDQIKKSFELETPDFQVFGVRHKFSPNMSIKRKFNHCLAPPLLINCGADGHVYLCVDHRGKPQFSLGTHYPNPENILTFWGSDRHKQMMNCVNLDKCPRCTFGIYNEIIEKTLLTDQMCRNFP